MNVASLKLCKELYELSGWANANDGLKWHTQTSPPAFGHGSYKTEHMFPLYDLGYLLRKLPPIITLKSRAGGRWYARCFRGKIVDSSIKKFDFGCLADTPEDALCELAIKLVKEGQDGA